MQCRKVEHNVVMNSARLLQRQASPSKLEEEILEVIPEKKSPKNLKRSTSGPIINLQQQIIIQQQPSSVSKKQKSPAKPKKKKKKKASKKKKVHTVERVQAEERVQQLLKSNLRKYKSKRSKPALEQKNHARMEEEMEKQRVVSFKEMRRMMDQQIRVVNNQRFSRNKSPSQMLPWGVDQSKLKNYWTKMLEIHDKLERPSQQQQTATEHAIKEKMRRHKLGLDFLNAKPENEIQRMISKQKSKKVLETISSPQRIKHNLNESEEQKLREYMIYKRELWRQQKFEEQQMKKIQKERLQQNLQILEQEAKMYAKSRNASVKQCSQSSAQLIIPSKPTEPPNFNKLEKEYKEVMRSLRQSSYSSTKSHSRRTSQAKFIDWLSTLPESFLQDQLQQMRNINQQLNVQGFNYKLTEQEMYSFLEQHLKEQFEHQTKASLRDRFQELQDRFTKQVPIKEEEPSYHSRPKPQITANEEEESLSPEETEHIYNVAATMIQKVWRGFKTRQLVFEYLKYLVSKQEELQDQMQLKAMENLGDFQEEEQKKKEPSPKLSNRGVIAAVPSEISEDEPELGAKGGTDEEDEEEDQEDHNCQETPRNSNNIPHLNLTSVSSTHTPQKKSCGDPEYFMQVLRTREEALTQKYASQCMLLEKMLDKKKVSMDSFNENKERLERKFKREKDKLSASKNELQRIQDLFKETVKSTQKDQQFMERIKMQQEEENLSIRHIFSIRSETEQSDGELNEKRQPPKYGLLQQLKHDHFKKQKNKKQVRSFDQQISFEEVSLKNEEIQTSNVFNTESLSGSLHKSQLQQSNYVVHSPQTAQQQQVAQHVHIPSPQQAQQIQGQSQCQPSAQPQLLVTEEYSDAQPQTQSQEQLRIQLIEPSSNIIMPFDDRRVESVTETIVQQIIQEFAEELNNFPLQSLGVLMEWDEESQQLPQGFTTTLNFIKDYLIAFQEFISKHHLGEFLEAVNTPLGITPENLLKTISLNDMGSASLDDSDSGPLYPLLKHIRQMEPLIREEIWLDFNRSYKGKLKYGEESTDEDMRNMEQCHLRMVYEAFNEAVNYVRPYGVRGQPYPWKANPLKLYANETTRENLDSAMGFAVAKMLKWGSFLCGFIPERIETPQGEVIVIEDDYLNQIKEDRLQQMLEYDIKESEEKWLNYDEEQAEVAVELADIVFEQMLDEAAEELFKIGRGQKGQSTVATHF